MKKKAILLVLLLFCCMNETITKRKILKNIPSCTEDEIELQDWEFLGLKKTLSDGTIVYYNYIATCKGTTYYCLINRANIIICPYHK